MNVLGIKIIGKSVFQLGGLHVGRVGGRLFGHFPGADVHLDHRGNERPFEPDTVDIRLLIHLSQGNQHAAVTRADRVETREDEDEDNDGTEHTADPLHDLLYSPVILFAIFVSVHIHEV